jgi:hypothetical protein
LGFTERFQINDRIVPSALMLSNHAIVKDLNALKVYLNNNGIQNSVFYGEDAFFIPNHQNLSHTEIDYFYEVLQSTKPDEKNFLAGFGQPLIDLYESLKGRFDIVGVILDYERRVKFPLFYDFLASQNSAFIPLKTARILFTTGQWLSITTKSSQSTR